jgi:alginate O-acetyltransferase complex protein AlgI
MIFTSFEFVAFFAIIVLLRGCLRSSSADKWLLLAASICFYLSWSAPCILLIGLMTLADFWVGRAMGQTADSGRRKRLLVFSILMNIGLLAFFKYTNFFLDNLYAALNALGWKIGIVHVTIILPPAISYFTFASLSYVLDVYYERLVPCRNPRDYALFTMFFPKLLSGPIVRGVEFLPQLNDRARASAEDIEIGLAYILLGAVKKLVIADQIAGHVNLIFSAPAQYDSITLLLGVMGYTVQMYCDFSGYSDMAIGCARLLGFRFPENFQMPFSAVSITEYWRRWHMTLSRWFRDYVFLPLEIATRAHSRPILRVSFNMTITMLLCGLWHGPSWNFVIWGGIHGAALAAHKAWSVWNPLGDFKDQRLFRAGWTALSHALTLGVVLLGMVFFRASSFSEAVSYLKGLAGWNQDGLRLGSPYILSGLIIVFLVHLIVGKDRNFAVQFPQLAMPARILAYSCLLVMLVLVGASDAVPFLYFQF